MASRQDSRLAVICLALFALISISVVTGASAAWDDRILVWLAGFRTPMATTFMRAVSWVGNWQGCVPFLLAVAALLWWRGRGAVAWRYLALALSGEVFWAGLKLLFHRPRPTIVPHLGDAGWYSYPSGHSTLAPVIWTLGFLLVAQVVRAHAMKVALWTCAVAVPIVIGVSRLYLGVHYPTDVLSGLVLGSGWVLLWRLPAQAERWAGEGETG